MGLGQVMHLDQPAACRKLQHDDWLHLLQESLCTNSLCFHGTTGGIMGTAYARVRNMIRLGCHCCCLGTDVPELLRARMPTWHTAVIVFLRYS